MADVATLFLDIDASQAELAAKRLEKFGASSKSAARDADRLANKLSGGYYRAFRDLEKGFNSGLVSAQEYSSGVNRLEAALSVSQTQSLSMAAALRQVDAASSVAASGLASAAAASNQLSAANRNTGAYTANVFAQLNDIGVMMAAGQNPIQLALQQGTQLNQVWSQMGDQGKSLRGVASVLGGAFASMLNPMSLLTIGVIAGSSALLQWAFSSDEVDKKAKTLSDKVDDLRAAVDKLKKSTEVFSKKGLEDAIEEFKLLDRSVVDLLRREKELANIQFPQILSKTIKDASDGFRDFNEVLNEVRRTYSFYKAEEQTFGATSNFTKTALSDFLLTVKDLEARFKLTQTEAYALSRALTTVTNSTDPTVISNNLGIVVDLLAKSSLAGTELHEALVEAHREALRISRINMSAAIAAAAQQASQLKIQLQGAADAMQVLSSANNSLKLGNIGKQAQLAALQAGKSEAAARVEAEIAEKRLEVAEALYSTETAIRVAANQRFSDFVAQKTQELALEESISSELDKRKDKRGGGAELARAQKQFQSLRELLEQETLFEFAEWEKRQAQLDLALQKRLLSEQQYQVLKSQLETYYFGSEYEKAALNYQLKQEQLDLALAQDLISRQRHAEEVAAIEAAQRNESLQGYSTLFSNMATIAKAGGDKATGVVKAFSIAQGLLNSYLAFTQVLADPSLIGRPFLRTALAYSTLGAGLAQVAAMRGSGGSGSAASSVSSAANASAQQQQLVEYKIYGDSFGADLVEDILTQIQRQQKDGQNLIIRRV